MRHANLNTRYPIALGLLLLMGLLTGCGTTSTGAPALTAVLSTTPAGTTPEAVVAQALDLLAAGDTVSLEALCSTTSIHPAPEIVYAMQQAWNLTDLPNSDVIQDRRVGPVISRQIAPAHIHGKTATVQVDFVHQLGSSIWQADLRQSNTGWTIDRLTDRSTTPIRPTKTP